MSHETAHVFSRAWRYRTAQTIVSGQARLVIVGGRSFNAPDVSGPEGSYLYDL